MLATFMLERNVDCIRGQRHFQIAAGRYQTSDPETIRFLRSYPNVALLSTEPDTPAPRAGGYVGATPVPDTAPAVRTTFGLQLKEKEQRGPRIAEQ
jgi:hypothetical protein